MTRDTADLASRHAATGGERVVETLRAAGVEVIFGLHGAHIDPIFQACLDDGLRIVDTRHEAAAGHAAEGYARIARKLGVALVTAGGGVTNVMTPLASAYLDRTPLLVLAGAGPVRDADTNTLQSGFDQVAIAAPVTKWAYRVTRADQIVRMLEQAIRIATTAPRGPVLIELPWDVLGETVADAEPVATLPPIMSGAASSADVSAMLDLLQSAERPVILVGSEASRGDSGTALVRLAKATGVPVFADYEALNLLADLPDALHGGLVQGLYNFGRAGARPDAVLSLGLRFGLNTAHGSGQLIPHAARIIQIDPDGRELGKLQRIERGVAADVGATIAALADAAESRVAGDHGVWQAKARETVAARRDLVMANAAAAPTDRFHPLLASAVLASHTGPGVTVVADGALTYLWLSEVIGAARPGGFLTHGYLGTMGFGFGTAVGAQIAGLASGGRTILVTGDGSVGFSIAEFDTAMRHHLPLIVVVMNNQSWGATLHYQQLAVGENRVTGTRLPNGRYHDVAKAFECDGYVATDAESFDRALAAALASDRPACINVAVDLAPIPPEEMILIGMDPFAPADAEDTRIAGVFGADA